MSPQNTNEKQDISFMLFQYPRTFFSFRNVRFILIVQTRYDLHAFQVITLQRPYSLHLFTHF